MCCVLNLKRDKIPDDAVFIGRPSKWGNKFIIGVHGTRRQVIKLYEEWLRASPKRMRAVRRELAGKDLVCYCKPKACHGDVLLRIANPQPSLFD